MPLMRGCNLKYGGGKRRRGKPQRYLMAQNALPLRDRTSIMVRLALAGDDKDQPLSMGTGIQNEAGQCGVGAGDGHPVQVDPRLGLEFAPRHALVFFPVHADQLTCGTGRWIIRRGDGG